MNQQDMQALAELLESFGLTLSVSQANAQQQPAGRPQRRLPSSGGVPRTATMALSDGRRLQLTETELRAASDAADLRFKLLAEFSTDLIVAVDADLAIRYASPATTSMLGCAPADLHGRTLAELLVPEERAAFIARHFTRAAQRGSGLELFRVLKTDGSTGWVEARVATLPPGNGLGDYLVTLRDAARRRQAEEVLGQANAELTALASTDALTGLANRRMFDSTLNKEWYRALRDGAPLALLMIDVDRFKPLNDLFGHQVGDAFLSLVGRVIRDTVRRAGDLAARYGGEEFAVVLPSTGASGALDIAEHIRRAVMASDTRGIVEGGYPVSVSIGVAATVPLAGSGATGLLHNADAALYQAKRNGRNRVEMLD